jgi:phage terminase large subunit-like protein
VYELDKRDEWQDLRFWIKPNPGLGTIKNREILESKVEKAKQNPYLIKNLLCKDFNWPETANEAWLSYDVAHNPATFDIEKLKPRYGIGGLDLSMTTDLTCATIIFKVRNNETIFVHQMYWLPADLLEKRVREDKIRYDLWLDAGWLRVSEGNKINYKDVVNWFKEEQEKHDLYVYRIGYDAWNSQYIVDELQANFGKISTVPIRQGAQTMSSPMKNFEADLAAKRINYNNNPITRWCLGNAAIKVDTNDNISLIKTSNPRKRIDGVSSLLDAYIVLENNADAYDSKI